MCKFTPYRYGKKIEDNLLMGGVWAGLNTVSALFYRNIF
jgi:hypothetical protein